MKREPVITAAVVVALIEALIVGAVAFGWDITGEQQASLMGIVIAAAAMTAGMVVPVVGAVWARKRVSPWPAE